MGQIANQMVLELFYKMKQRIKDNKKEKKQNQEKENSAPKKK